MEKYFTRFFKKTYEVRITGTSRKKVKAHYDFNGYYCEEHVKESTHRALFNSEGVKCFTINVDKKVFDLHGICRGSLGGVDPADTFIHDISGFEL